MLYENKIITRNEIKKILKGLENLKKEKFDKKTDSEFIHELIESLIIKKVELMQAEKCILDDHEMIK